MDSLTKVNDEWVPLQAKVFSRWVSAYLKGKDQVDVKDITKDLSNGVALVELAEMLTHKKANRSWDHNPKNNIGKVQNCDLALDMFEKDGVKLVGISGKDISDNNEKLILGLIWSLVLHYSIGSTTFDDSEENSKVNNSSKVKADSNAQNQLISWAVKRTENYQNVKSFVPYDLAMCALLDSYHPEKINFKSLNVDDHAHNAQLATDVMKDLGITCFIYPEDLEKNGSKVDRMTLLTQLSVTKAVLDESAQKKDKLKADQEAKILLAEEESKLRAEEEARRREEEEKIKAEERAVAQERERQKAEEEARLRATEEARRKAEEEARLRAAEEARRKAEEEERIRAENEEKMRAEARAVAQEQERVRAEQEAQQKEEEARIMAEEEAKQRAEEEKRLQSEQDANKRAEEEAKLRDEAISRAKAEEEKRIKAEEYAQKVEEEKRALEAKLREAEEARKKAERQLIYNQNDTESILRQAVERAIAEEENDRIEDDRKAKMLAEKIEDQLDEKQNKSKQNSATKAASTQSEMQRDQKVRVRIRIHGKNPFNENKKLKVGLKINDNRLKNDNPQRHLVCKKVTVVTRKNGNVIPSAIDGPITKDGQKQLFRVKLL
ncbi:hypothetical protein M9Y10_041630 [Tritrichomonas musculus]|uniref:Calponin-homology (CH) domain-containing protein n=1 Tax=Tritrichomonas musculus TaxID=1915356 RepID=A0ABR2K4V5_9EUKA